MFRSLRSTSLLHLVMVVCVMALGLLAAPFAEAGTLAVKQVAMATTPNHYLTAIPAKPVMALVLASQRSTDAVEATLLTKTKMIGGIAMATFTSASYQSSVALLEKRSCSSHTTLYI